MPLSKTSGQMYPWVSHCHTHLGGECPHKCSYCYVQATERRFHGGRYVGEVRLIEKEFAVNYGSGKTIFVEHCNDLFAEGVPAAFVARVLAHCRMWPDNEYVFQTKNPGRYEKWIHLMPPRRLLGCTIESTVPLEGCAAPAPTLRVTSMLMLPESERRFITIEPILAGDMDILAEWCNAIQPEFVNIGADSKGNDLPEPSAAAVKRLIRRLQEYGVEIREKRNLGRLK